MYGLGDDIQALSEEVTALRKQLRDTKILTQLLLDNPKNVAVKNAVKIALSNIKDSKATREDEEREDEDEE